MPLAIITGANTGLGFETARGLLQVGFEVVITSRNLERGEKAVARLKSEYPKGQISALALDLSNQSSVRAFAPRFTQAQKKSALGPAGSPKSYSAGASYSASKLSNYLFAIELQNRFGSESFSSLAAHPGFARAEPYGPKSTRFFESFMAQSAAKGALPIIEAATDSSLPGGSYRVPKILELWGEPSEGSVPKITNRDSLIKNWEVLETLSGETLAL